MATRTGRVTSRFWVTPEIEQEVISLHASGMPHRRIEALIAEKNGLSSTRKGFVQGILSRHRIEYNARIGRPRAKTCNEFFFETIDTEAKAYWLGFIHADGCIVRGGKLQISLAAVDEPHLWKFRDAINSDHKISCNAKYNSVGITITSQQMCNDLVRHGVLPRKSTVGGIPCVAPEFRRHFWRGVVDGDGHLLFARGAPVLGITGHDDTLNAFISYCDEIGISDWKIHSTHARTNRVDRSHTAAWMTATCLYQGSTISLDRKMEKYRLMHAWGQARIEKYTATLELAKKMGHTIVVPK